MTDARAKLKTCLQQRQLHHHQLAAALLQTTDPFTDIAPWQKLAIPLPTRTLTSATWRNDATRFFRGTHVASYYRSSGTTTASRSVSLFSSEGLLFYRAAAVFTFAAVLDRYWGNAAQHARGISLLDYTAKHSSLATMLRWFSKFWPLPRLSPTTLRAHLNHCNQQQPVFLWASSKQLLQLLTTTRSLPLPPRSIVIETGGYKKLLHAPQQQTFHRRLLDLFDIPPSALCSEYSMCELAAQAWRIGLHAPFAFPVWVQTRVSRDDVQLATRGHGTLCVYDPLRIDYPQLLRCEDLVTLTAPRQFQLHGRVPHAPLRGCSLDQRLAVGETKKNCRTPNY